MKKIILLIILISVAFAGCNDKKEEPAVFTNKASNSNELIRENIEENNDMPEYTDLAKKILSDFKYGIHTENYDMYDNNDEAFAYFDNMDYIAMDIELSEGFPTDFVLKCFVDKKIPIITVKYSDSVYEMIKFVKDGQKLNLPVYFDVFPCFGDENAKIYKESFSTFCSILKKNFPNSKIIWSCNAIDKEDFSDYFPDEEIIDYIGAMAVFETPYDCLEEIKAFKVLIEKYSEIKPIIITKFAVSHYDSKTHTYLIDGAEKFIEYFYDYLCPYLNNIEAVIYFDESNLSGVYNGFELCDYSISDEKRLREIYSILTKD